MGYRFSRAHYARVSPPSDRPSDVVARAHHRAALERARLETEAELGPVTAANATAWAKRLSELQALYTGALS